MKIGVTFHTAETPRSVWSCGADQNCMFLLDALRAVPGVEEVAALACGDGLAASPDVLHGRLGLRLERIESALPRLDVLVQMGMQVSPEHADVVHSNGGAVVAYKFGSEYLIDAERIIHGKPAGGIVNGTRFDAIWATPQHETLNHDYWETLYRAPVEYVPHIWAPTFVDLAVAEFRPGVSFGYKPGRVRKRIVITEPNVNVIKLTVPAMLVAERAHRLDPDLIEHVYCAAAEKIKEHLTVRSIVGALDLHRDGKVSFEARYPLPWMLAKNADAVVAHQWECALNYAYWETLHGHYPLIHNSPMIPDGVGYRYDGFEFGRAGRVLADALRGHDHQRSEYDDAADRYLSTLMPDHPANVEAHGRALAHVLERRKAA